eukprot:447405-Prorocentrum_minimum.AAC.1
MESRSTRGRVPAHLFWGTLSLDLALAIGFFLATPHGLLGYFHHHAFLVFKEYRFCHSTIDLSILAVVRVVLYTFLAIRLQSEILVEGII